MLTRLYPRTCLILAAASLTAGCAQPGPIMSRYTTIGALKTSLSQIEFENRQLRTKVATLESENRDIENRLVQEESVNGDLSARLDDARDLLGRQGYNWGGSSGSSGPDGAPSRTLPAGRSNRSQRKPPFARIPGRGDSARPSDGDDDTLNRSGIPSAESFGPQSMRDDGQWLPIARGTRAPATKLR
jgi:hypothetical protein